MAGVGVTDPLVNLNNGTKQHVKKQKQPSLVGGTFS